MKPLSATQARAFHIIVRLPLQYKKYIFGGKGEGGLLFNDLWVLDVETWSWSMLPASSSLPPSPRMNASLTPVADKLVAFGGWDGKGVAYGDTWIFDSSTGGWARPPTTGVAPTPRYGHSAAFDEAAASLVIWGGSSLPADGVPVPTYMNDLRVLDLRTLTWTRPRFGGDVPPPRYMHAAAAVGNVKVVMGGWDGPRKDKKEADDKDKDKTGRGAGGAASAAAAAAAAASIPPVREWPAITIDIPYCPGMGGDALAGAGSSIAVPYGQSDVFLFDLESSEWIQPCVAGRPPGYRYGAAACSSGAQVFQFGGWEGGRARNDTILLDLSGLVAGPDGGAGGPSDGAGAGGAGAPGYGPGGEEGYDESAADADARMYAGGPEGQHGGGGEGYDDGGNGAGDEEGAGY